MTLLLFVIIAVVVGYLLSRSRFSQSIDDTAGKVASSSRSWSGRADDWWQSHLRKRSLTEPFKAWAAGKGADLLPAEFKSWLAGLSNREAEAFIQSLDAYSSDLGYNLKKLVEGEYDSKPALMQVFVEAIVVYSQEFRKAKEVDDDQQPEQPDQPETEMQKTAAKQSSRRKQSPAQASEAPA